MSSNDDTDDLEIGIDPDSTPRERLEASLKTPYPADGPVWSAFLDALEAEFEELNRARQQIAASRFVDTAGAAELERLATIFDLERRTDDSLPEFRLRIKAALRSQITSATVPEIAEIVALLLGVETNAIAVDEPSHLEPATIFLDVADELQGVEISDSTFIEVVESVVAAGVQVGILVSEEHSDSLVIGDIGVAGDEVDGPEVLGIEDTGELDTIVDETDSLGLADTGEVETIVQEADAVALGDDPWHRTDAIQQGVWNEGRYDLDFWNTALQEFSVTEPVTLAIADVGLVDDEPTAIETAALADDVDARIEAVETATWNEGRVNIDGYA